MKKIILIVALLAAVACKDQKEDPKMSPTQEDSTFLEETEKLFEEKEPLVLSIEQANNLSKLPLKCLHTEFPNKLGQVLGNKQDLATPRELHPAFYGCFDWHSSVHAHWSLVTLLKGFSGLNQEKAIREALTQSLTQENIQGEIVYFKKENNKTYERTYGWAWLLKLAETLHNWDDPLARELEDNLQPLTDLIVGKFENFLPKLNYPIRVGEHSNTAFAMVLAFDYAKTTENEEFLKLIKSRANDFYLHDDDCPLDWEPSGFDFLSPCLSEIDIMRRVLPQNAFLLWMGDFMPQLKEKSFSLEPGVVSDRTDDKLVHLDGLNFSRSWVLNGLANHYPEYKHLKPIARKHIEASLPNVAGDSYEGGHWLGTFAIYALQAATKKE